MTIHGSEIAAAKDRALTANTAQSVRNQLMTLESSRAHVRTRWIWELLQNARDAGANRDGELDVKVALDQNRVVFSHNGSPFTIDQIMHLIYHGSTKVEDELTIGQYGSGFLATHLLSPEIDISGVLEDGRTFSFQLEREIGSPEELTESMNAAVIAFEASLSDAEASGTAATVFSYPLDGDAIDVAQAGIEALRECAPFIVVFNREFLGIQIDFFGDVTLFRKSGTIPLAENGFEMIEVAETSNRTDRSVSYLAAHGEKTSIAIPVADLDGVRTCMPIVNVPRLFLGFPLIGTENFSFPVVINSFHFRPTPERDGVFLYLAEDEANRENEAVLEEACQLLIRLVQYAGAHRMRECYRLANIPDVESHRRLGESELRHLLVDTLLGEIQQTPMVVTASGEVLPPNQSSIAFADTPDGVLEVWHLLVDAQNEDDYAPKREEATGWCDAVKSWSVLTDRDGPSFSGVYDGRKLALWVAGERKVSTLESRLRPGVSAICWLDRLVSFLYRNFPVAIRELHIVPDQNGSLHNLPDLHRDMEISTELKDVCDAMEWPVRDNLRDIRIESLAGESGAGDWDNEHVVTELLVRLHERSRNNPDEMFKEASTGLFSWLAHHRWFDTLRGFPAFAARSSDDDEAVIVHLPQDDHGPDQPFGPINTWPEDLIPYSDLFPFERILDQHFFDALPNPEIWTTLVSNGLVRTEVLVSRKRKISKFYPDHPVSEGGGHTTQEEVAVTDIWSRAEIMDRVRDSQARARLFWRFLLEWLAHREDGTLEPQSGQCECGETHRYYPTLWLQPVRENDWIRMSNPDGRALVSAKSLAVLLRGSDWEPAAINDNPAADKLLRAIGTSRYDLVFEFLASDDEERTALDDALTNILDSTGGDIGQLEHGMQFMKDLQDNPDLPNELAELRMRKRQMDGIRRLGGHVEDLVRQCLEHEGFDVCRTGTGSDFRIEYNDIIRLELAKSDSKWLVEVKATQGSDVRMSGIQAAKAVEQGDGFLLCVVPVEVDLPDLELDMVRASMKFVQNIGPRVHAICNDLDRLEGLRQGIVVDDNSGFQLELDNGNPRVRVAEDIWETHGFVLSELLNRLQ